jgi:NADP-dependent 3-hydroxy acid dehydrogenase YdfG
MSYLDSAAALGAAAATRASLLLPCGCFTTECVQVKRVGDSGLAAMQHPRPAGPVAGGRAAAGAGRRRRRAAEQCEEAATTPAAGAAGVLKGLGLAAVGLAAAQEVWRRSREKDLRGDVALVTGAGSGIGREMSLLLAKAGCRLVLWGRREEPLQRVADEIRALAAAAEEDGSIHADVLIDSVDVGSKAEVEAAAARVLSELGRCDLLINNAGVHEGVGALERSEEEIRAIFDVNVMSHFWTMQAFVPGMLERDHGHVVTVGSAAGVIGVAGMLDYNASKFAVRAAHNHRTPNAPSGPAGASTPPALLRADGAASRAARCAV